MTDESEVSPIVNRRQKGGQPLQVHIHRIVEPTPTIKKKNLSKKKVNALKVTDETSETSSSECADCKVKEPKKVLSNTK